MATNPAVKPHDSHLTDSSRSALAVTDRRRLWLLDAHDLRVRHHWELGDGATGRHGVRAADQMALVSGLGEVTLLDARGNRSWGFAHPPWSPGGGLQSGCAWFDDGGEAFALVPATHEDGLCEVVHLSGRDGTPLARAPVSAAPAGLYAIHQPGGWVGLSIGEGQDGAFAWWVRRGTGGLELIEAPWDDEILFDVDPTGRHVLTTPHADGPLRIRTFPDLAVAREIDPPEGLHWDYFACFAGDHVVARVLDYAEVELLVAVDRENRRTQLEPVPDSLSPGPAGSWFTAREQGIERWALGGA